MQGAIVLTHSYGELNCDRLPNCYNYFHCLLPRITPAGTGPSSYLKDVNLDNVDHHTDLGVVVDDHCIFKQHVSYICKKA